MRYHKETLILTEFQICLKICAEEHYLPISILWVWVLLQKVCSAHIEGGQEGGHEAIELVCVP